MSCIQELEFTAKIFIDKSTTIYGETGTGKSVVIVNILQELAPMIDQIIVFAPQDRQNKTYENNIVPLPFIHYKITSDLLLDLWERQEALVSIYMEANKPEVVDSLFNRIPGIEHVHSTISEIDAKYNEYLRSGDETRSKDAENEYIEVIKLIKVKFINKNHATLRAMDLSHEERRALKYINLNPRLVIIFDDCTDIIKKFKTHPVIQKLFYQGRWAYITTLIACHTDKALDPELKKNAFVQIFTEESAAHAFFERKSNDLDKEAIRRATAALKQAFVPSQKFQKLAFIRDEKKFYKFTAKRDKNFKFGSAAIWKYSEQIQNKDGVIGSSNNKFMIDFT